MRYIFWLPVNILFLIVLIYIFGRKSEQMSDNTKKASAVVVLLFMVAFNKPYLKTNRSTVNEDVINAMRKIHL